MIVGVIWSVLFVDRSCGPGTGVNVNRGAWEWHNARFGAPSARRYSDNVDFLNHSLNRNFRQINHHYGVDDNSKSFDNLDLNHDQEADNQEA